VTFHILDFLLNFFLKLEKNNALPEDLPNFTITRHDSLL